MRMRARGNESGSVLLWVLVVGLFAVGALGATTRLIPAGRRLADQDLKTTFSMITAESAVHYVAHEVSNAEQDDLEEIALRCLARRQAPDLDEPDEAFDICKYVYIAFDPDREYIYLTAQVGDMKRNLRAKLNNRREPVQVERDVGIELDVAVFALAGPHSGSTPLDLSEGPTIHGAVGTNAVAPGSVEVGWGVTIKGDIFVGPISEGQAGSVVSKPEWMTLNNAIIPRERREYPLPDFPAPFELPWRGTVATNWDKPRIVIDEPGHYDSITANNYTVVFETGDRDLHVRTRSLEARGSGTVEILGNGRLFLYVDEKLTLIEGASLKRNSDPMKSVIFYAGAQPLTLGSGVRYAGVLYIKDADVTITEGFNADAWIFSGGRKVTLSGGAGLGDSGIVYAPNAHVYVSQGASTGVVISNSFRATGGVQITHRKTDMNKLPIKFPHELDPEEVEDPAEEVFDHLQWHVCWEGCLSDPAYVESSDEDTDKP